MTCRLTFIHLIVHYKGSNTLTSMSHTLPMMTTTSSRVPSTQLTVHTTNWIHGVPLTSFTTKLEALTSPITLIRPSHITKHRLPLMPSKRTSLKFTCMILHQSLKPYGEFARDVRLSRRGEITTSGTTRMSKRSFSKFKQLWSNDMIV